MDAKNVINAWACSQSQSISASAGLVIIFFPLNPLHQGWGCKCNCIYILFVALRIWLFFVLLTLHWTNCYYLLYGSYRSSYSSWLWEPLESPLGSTLLPLLSKPHTGRRQFAVWLDCNLRETTYCVIEDEICKAGNDKLCWLRLYISAGNSLRNVQGELSLFWLLDGTEYSSPVLLKSTVEMRGNQFF